MSVRYYYFWLRRCTVSLRLAGVSHPNTKIRTNNQRPTALAARTAAEKKCLEVLCSVTGRCQPCCVKKDHDSAMPRHITTPDTTQVRGIRLSWYTSNQRATRAQNRQTRPKTTKNDRSHNPATQPQAPKAHSRSLNLNPLQLSGILTSGLAPPPRQ